MINSFQSINTITSGLVLQQLEQEINASNIANPSVDADGYLMNSLQQVNSTPGAELTLSGIGGPFQVSTDPTVESITRLRSSFLDSQIQKESSLAGYAEILSNASGSGILDQINSIINGTTTLNGALNSFSAAWGTLASNPTNGSDQSAVVRAGENFAQLANSQYNQLQNLLNSNTSQINTTVGEINGILNQLVAINQQLLNTPGSNQNSLLDARDYALDRLARLVNIQTNITATGTVSVYLSGSNVALVDANGAAIFQTNVENPNHPQLLGITVQTPEGGFYGASVVGKTATPNDLSQWITGGNLAGELKGQGAIIGYQDQLDQIANSVINVTNTYQASGYAADGLTTGNNFFSGLSAQDIAVNPVLLGNNSLVGASLFPKFDPNYAALNPAFSGTGVTYQGTVAEYLSNLPSLLANNYAQSQVGIAGAYYNPTVPVSTPGLLKAPTSGTFTVNGVTVTYTAGTDTIDTILAKITQADPSVYAVYNAATETFSFFSSKPVTIGAGSSNFVGGVSSWSNINSFLTSTIRMNSSLNPLFSQIDYFEPTLPNPDPSALNSTIPSTTQPNTGPNSQSFLIVPSASGSFTFYPPFPNGTVINWNNTMDLNTITNAITAATGGAVTASFNTNTETLTLLDSTPQPMDIQDITGNFTVFTGLNGNQPVGSIASGVLGQISGDLATAKTQESQASSSLTQLNNAQANIAGVATSSGQAGVPIATIEQQAVQSLISYNAMLEVLQVIDNMYVDLVNMLGGSTSTSSFAPESTSSTI